MAAIGFGLGLIGSMPIGGPVSLFVVKRSTARRYRDGVLLSVGAAVAEAAYCAAALYGTHVVLDRWPHLKPMLALLGGVVLVGVGVHFMLARHAWPDGAPAPAAATGRRDFALGFTLVALNPSVLVNWLAVLAALQAVGLKAMAGTERILFVGGVAVGIVAWFSALIWLLHQGRARIQPTAVGQALRVFGFCLCVLGLYTIYVRRF